MSNTTRPAGTSRRSLLAALTATAAGAPLVSLTGAATAHAAPAAVPLAAPAAAPAGTVAAGLTTPRSAVTVAALGADWFTPVTLGTLTTAVLAGTPARTEVTAAGKRVALLTHGARTVVLPGPERTFTENKRPFADDFQRTLPDPALPEADRVYWGTAPAGGGWTTLGGAATDFAVTPGAGTITLTTDFASRHASIRDGEITDVDVRSVAKFDKVPTGQACSYALSFGYQDTHNNYRARLSFLTSGAVELRVEKEVDDVVTQLVPTVALATGVAAGTNWTIRVRRVGAHIQAKAWRTDSAEPSAWSAEADDTTFGKGRVGLRALANDGCTNLPVKLTVSRFEVTQATWQNPPSVTHRDWVRVLDQPFDGTVTPALEAQIRAWAGSTAPDVLAYAAMFLPGAPAVTSGAAPTAGKQVLGQAGYGYLDPQGNRYEGADFHEYMNLGWTFPDGTYTGPSSKQVGNLDCSGFTRMVFGHHHKVPMAAGSDTSKTRLPRKSRDMVDYAPGARIDQTTGTGRPDAVLLQPGDLLLFNADSGDDNPTVTVDHVGIYLGKDADGKRRFVSSRKTGNGPTMSDLAGASILDGNGTYAEKLHTVHRI
ncbi:C40 family peptidase [Streptomyces bambusae]|uniref:NlpC/P60 family protein n=1 Tax=Streptomyces bambusae TaxID=1550616 RepID=UPI001CFF9995|nr:NlpC/P60 family protein [Streptomyces bambusae]MCB5169230.1 C40 family peptidase [Streptomyces bambusae]